MAIAKSDFDFTRFLIKCKAKFCWRSVVATTLLCRGLCRLFLAASLPSADFAFEAFFGFSSGSSATAVADSSIHSPSVTFALATTASIVFRVLQIVSDVLYAPPCFSSDSRISSGVAR